ncbi:IS701 family transposase [Streptomyces sp. 184]|uniref:IS701 family transposase n=1 Tax=Streptomyces sp. 184 TaxID=1827526 RepID=UPI0038920C50
MRGNVTYPSKFIGDAIYASELPADLLGSLFASLPRADQRRKGIEYVTGLLHTPGRKSARNMASRIGGRAADQSLHHFINQSTWAWRPVRQALAHYLLPRFPVDAWVVRRALVQKVGEHSVGVARRFVPAVGRVLNAQQAVGVWAASGERSTPVDWELHLPQGWLDDPVRRRRAAIPDDAVLESYADQITRLCLGLVHDWDLPVRPVVLDARGLNVGTIVGGLGRAGIPVMARVDESVPLMVADRALTGHRVSSRIPAGELMRASRGARRPVRWWDHMAGGVRMGQLAGVTVGLVDRATGTALPRGGGSLTLMGLTQRGKRETPQLWLTDLPAAQPAPLLRLCTLLKRVDHDYASTAKSVGIEDYVGRSFCGWHRHMTLASVAHAVSLLISGNREMALATPS